MNKKISVIMPAYNYDKFIQEAIDGILNQTYQNFELIIVDDGSTDSTWSILKKQTDPRIKIIHKENGGCGSALNVGFAMATGEYETWFATDNKMYPNALKEMVLILDTKPEIDFVYCCCDEAITKEDGHIELREDYNTDGMVWNPMGFYDRFNIGVVWLWRKELRMKAGEKYMEAPCEDYDMTCRMIEAGGKFYYNKNRQGWYRIHDMGLQGKLKKEQPTYIKELTIKAKKRRDEKITKGLKIT
jgi:glycosyltransferase involved in cell wall biosynthesis